MASKKRAKPTRKTTRVDQMFVTVPNEPKNVDIEINYEEQKLTIMLPKADALKLVEQIQVSLAFHPRKPVKLDFNLEQV